MEPGPEVSQARGCEAEHIAEPCSLVHQSVRSWIYSGGSSVVSDLGDKKGVARIKMPDLGQLV